MKFETRKIPFFVTFGLGLPRWILGFGHLDMPKISFEPGFPRDSEAAQTARRNDQGTERGGDSGDAMHSCDEPKKLMGKIFLDPETNNKFAPETYDGWKTTRLPFGARFIFRSRCFCC